jgi:hypothetical protein
VGLERIPAMPVTWEEHGALTDVNPTESFAGGIRLNHPFCILERQGRTGCLDTEQTSVETKSALHLLLVVWVVPQVIRLLSFFVQGRRVLLTNFGQALESCSDCPGGALLP